MNKTAATYKSNPNVKTSSPVTESQSSRPFSTVSIIIIAVLALLAIGFGVLWGLQYFGPDYKRQTQVLSTQVDTLQSEVQALRETNAAMREQLGLPLEVGFEVQIAAFQHYDIEASAEQLVRLAEIQQGGFNKYVLGRFRHFEDAEAFLKDMQTLGLYDAFIAGIVNGERATVEEAKKAAKDYYGQ